MITPTIHLNGTGADRLLDDVMVARTALRAAVEALAAVGPNARDYYVQGEHAYGVARREHEEREAHFRTVAGDLDTLAESIADQRDAIEASRARARGGR